MDAIRKPLKVKLGDWTVWSLSDGYLDIDQRMLFDKDPSLLKDELHRAKVSCVEEYMVRTQVNVYLIDTNGHLILVDTGCGMLFGPTVGFLCDQLKQLGYDASDISHVLMTHLHGDHMGGLVDSDGEKLFSKATLYVPEIDAVFWRDYAQETTVKDILRPNFSLANKALAPYESDGKLQLVKPKDVVIPGVKAIEAFGHTPGHMAFEFQSKDKVLLIWGDIVHTVNLQSKNPEWPVSVDIDPGQGFLSRKRLLEEAADQRLLVGGGHLPSPGLGYVARSGNHFTWESL